MDYDFTAQLEEDLDQVAQGDADFREVLNQFYEGFRQRLERPVKACAAIPRS